MKNITISLVFLLVISKTVLGTLDQNSAVWVPTLNFKYSTQEFFSEDWHSKNLKYVKSFSDVIESNKRPNVAVTCLKIIYEVKKGELKESDIVFPYLFISGWDKLRLIQGSNYAPDDIINLLKEKNRELSTDYTENPIFIKTAHSKVKNKKKYIDHLKKIYSSRDTSDKKKEISSRLNRVPDTYNFLIKEVLPSLKENSEEAIQIKENFHSRFYDTEQAFYLNIISRAEEAIKSEINIFSSINSSECLIHGFVLNIASYNDICLDCSDTGFRQSEARRGFKKALEDYVFKTYPKQLEGTEMRPFFTFIEVSSYKQTIDRQRRWKSRSEMTNFSKIFFNDNKVKDHPEIETALIQEDFLNLEAFGDYIVQKAYNLD